MAHGTWNMRHDKHTITTSLVTVMWRGVDRHRVLGSMSMPRHVAAPSPPHLRLSPPVHPIRLVLSYFPCGASQSPHRPARPRPSLSCPSRGFCATRRYPVLFRSVPTPHHASAARPTGALGRINFGGFSTSFNEAPPSYTSS